MGFPDFTLCTAESGSRHSLHFISCKKNGIRMSDIIDAAQELQLKQINVQPRDYSTPSLTECEECGNAIPAERQKLGAVTLCIECKSLEEKYANRYR